MPKKVPTLVQTVQESKLKQSKANKHISFSQLSVFHTCQRLWFEQYIKKTIPYIPSIHATFGTAMHETIQAWLKVMYEDTIKASDELDLGRLLHENLKQTYKVEKAKNGFQHYSNSQELQSFYEDGIAILDFLKKNRKTYFSTKNTYLAGIETLLYQELKPGVFFKGFVDLIFYDEDLKKWYILDIKTSTAGWDKATKANNLKVSQIIMYKKFLSEQFNIPIEDIEVKYFIIKRKVNEDAEFAAMKKRVQEFEPAAGKVKLKQAEEYISSFIHTTLDSQGAFIEKEYPTSPSKDHCKYCDLKKLRICPDAVL